MAEPDHTVLARLSGLPDALFNHPLDDVSEVSDVDEEARLERASALACMEVATCVITCLLADSDAYREARADGFSPRPDQWPLTPASAGGLLVAMHFLHRYAETLRFESGR